MSPLRRLLSPGRPLLAALAAAAAFALIPTAASAAASPTAPTTPTVPAEFGTDWHDPVTAAPPVAVPRTPSCTVTVAEARFRDFTPYTGTYTPPAGCGTRWSKVVLRMHGGVAGRQYDRLGYLRIGGVEVLRTSTPEPSPDGIEWSVEKDVTRYSPTLRTAQPVEMLIGNVVDDTYTGVLDVKVTLTFWTGRPAAGTPDTVIPLDGTALTTPRNSERIVAEVYATGSGGGCEEFWYLAVPSDVPYSCQGGADGPVREVRISVDGRLAGIAAPYPHVWTGGWSNPFLWYVVPAPRAFDVQPVDFDLTPFAGLLNDGREHKVEITVAGVPQGQSGWSVPANVLVWRDAHRPVVTGALTSATETAPAVTNTYTPESADSILRRLDATGSHTLTVSGYVDTSHGRVTTTVRRTVTAHSTHRWSPDESTDALTGRWTDDGITTVNGRPTAAHRAYTMDGETTIGSDNRLRTVISLGDHSDTYDDVYRGDASWTLNVPRDQRHAVGTSYERYRTAEGRYDRTLATEQGVLTEDRLRR